MLIIDFVRNWKARRDCGGQVIDLDKWRETPSAALEAAAEKVHDEWRQKRRKEFEQQGVMGETPLWKRVDSDDYDAWAASLDPAVLEAVHRHRPPQADNPNAPADQEGAAGSAVHWVDINQPYATLPETWKAKNRAYAEPPLLSHVSPRSSTPALLYEPISQPFSQTMLLEERPPQSSPAFVREHGSGSIEMQEFKPSKFSAGKKQSMPGSKTAKAAALAIGKKGRKGQHGDAASVEILINED